MIKKLIMKTRLGRLLKADEINTKMRAKIVSACHELAKAKMDVRMLSVYGRQDKECRDSACSRIDKALDRLAEYSWK